MRNILDLLAIFTASIAHLISGVSLVTIGRVHSRMFIDTDMELPLISKASAAYTATATPIIVGVVIGLATLIKLGLVYRSERARWLLPFLLSLSFVVLTLHIMFVSFGVTLPLIHMIHMMDQ